MLYVATVAHLRYIGDCGTLRRGNPRGEAFWQEMMRTARPITITEFLRHVDPTPFLDEGETLAAFMTDNPDAQTYAATVANRPVFFIQTAGFEFIFAPDSVIKLRLR